MNLPGADTGAFQAFYFGKVFCKERRNSMAGFDDLIGCLSDARQKKLEPAFPIPCLPYSVKAVIVFQAIVFEEQTEVEQRLFQVAHENEKEGNQQAADTAIPIKKRVDRFKLNMDKPRINHRC